jgi:acetoin utilization deacetylase AcuC-like enzyme
MNLLFNTKCLGHDTGNHPESKKRLEAFGVLPQSVFPSDEQYLTLVHTQDYVQKIKEECKTPTFLDRDTIVGPGSWEAALTAVNATISASHTNDFALVRPPGHHAHADHASGFCLFNNIAIATQKLVSEGKKVFIFDFDGHLGDGTEDFFYKTDKVLYWSLHQFPAFPNRGLVSEIGDGPGKGYTINIPLPEGTNDDMYLSAVHTFLPAAKQFSPDVVAVSAGFDGHRSDQLLQLKLSTNVYYELGKILSANFKNIFATLEGGYQPEILVKCVTNFLDGINGNPMKYQEEPSGEPLFLAQEEYDDTIARLTDILKTYWKLP